MSVQILASKFIYLEEQNNLYLNLKPFENLAIQLSFFKKQEFFKINHQFLKNTCLNLNIEIPTLHAPTVDIFDQDFLPVIELLKEIYKVRLISIHPQKGELNFALAKLEEYAGVIKDLDIILAYENFPSMVAKKKWIVNPYQMYTCFRLSFLKLTFDTSHLDSPSDCIQEFRRIFDKVAVIHLSDSNQNQQHLALGNGLVPYQQFLTHLKTSGFRGPIVLEYMPQYQDQLIKDVKDLKNNNERFNLRRR